MARQRFRFKWQDAMALPFLGIAGLILDSTPLVTGCLALATLAFCVSIATHRELRRRWRVSFALVAVAVALVTVHRVAKTNEQKELEKNEGVLYPADDPSPPLACGEVTIHLGSVAAGLRGNLETPVLMLGGKRLLSLRRDADTGALVVTNLTLFDDRGDVIAAVDEGKFWVRGDCRKKRPDRSTLVVYDHGNTPVLNVRFMNPHSIRVTGLFRNKKSAVSVTENGLVLLPSFQKIQIGCLDSNGARLDTILDFE